MNKNKFSSPAYIYKLFPSRFQSSSRGPTVTTTYFALSSSPPLSTYPRSPSSSEPNSSEAPGISRTLRNYHHAPLKTKAKLTRMRVLK